MCASFSSFHSFPREMILFQLLSLEVRIILYIFACFFSFYHIYSFTFLMTFGGSSLIGSSALVFTSISLWTGELVWQSWERYRKFFLTFVNGNKINLKWRHNQLNDKKVVKAIELVFFFKNIQIFWYKLKIFTILCLCQNHKEILSNNKENIFCLFF